MNSLRHIPLHMLLLAGLAVPQVLSANAVSSPTPVVKNSPSGYAGISPVTLDEKLRKENAQTNFPAGMGVVVGFIDPKGPAAGNLEQGDVLTRFDDQVLVNAEQFRALIQMHQAGDVVKIVLVRGDENKTVELKLGSRASPVATKAKSTPSVEKTPAKNDTGLKITINGQTVDMGEMPIDNGTITPVGPGQVVILGPNQGLPPEVAQQLEEMRRRGLPIPKVRVTPAPTVEEKVATPPAMQSRSQSFSFSLGNGAAVSSNSVACDCDGTVNLQESNGKKHAIIRDASGKVLFDGDVTTEEDRAKMSSTVRNRLKLVETNSLKVQGGDMVYPSNENNSDEPIIPTKKNNPKDGA